MVTNAPAGVEDVLSFWFPPPARLVAREDILRQVAWWFRGGADPEILARFPATLEAAAGGALDGWADGARSRLALIIVLDQFSRTIHRGTPAVYAQDAKALALAVDGQDAGLLAELATPWEKVFFILPLGHSEVLAYQERSVAVAEELAATAAPEHREMLAFSASQSRGHRDTIARFGRHPHRNALLSRTSTADELAFLATEQIVHTRPLPK
jgi:uncharacterized protein (DUF924 family)